ncbi:hypothetical protein Tcan_14708 [Toxocara canis]|uniref:MADF domain-containing protein n=2 Tax=Toxocara canis TaxID=6265 RepID=A0A0B2UUG7_TOXCA|nr:hypothetical protein Tcan_14708 [Toxocara canis]VDM38249.1 unnamed protein product [Toxocara canis]
MSTLMWTDDLRECLLDCYQSRPPLWNYLDLYYKNSSFTNDLRNEVATILSAKAGVPISADEVAKQWKSLKDQYVRYLGKVNRFTVGLEQKLPTFKFSRRMKFFVPARGTIPPQSANANWEVENPPSLSPHEVKAEMNAEIVDPLEILATSSSSVSFPQKRKRIEQQVNKTDRSLDVTVIEDVPQRSIERERERDVYDSLGETLADSLRTMHECSPLDGIEYKCEILELIAKYERKKLRL